MKKILWGFSFIVIGFVICLNTLGIWHIDIFFKGWWTLFIIIPCFIGLFSKDFFGNIIGLLIGVSLLLASQGIISFGLIAKLIFPVTLMIIGFSILIRALMGDKERELFKKANFLEDDYITAIFASQKIKPLKEFKNNRIEAIFGGIDLDLREVDFKEETFLKVNVIFGGATIILPNDVNVVVRGIPIFGGIDNKVVFKDANKKTLYIDCNVIFGGVDIK